MNFLKNNERTHFEQFIHMTFLSLSSLDSIVFSIFIPRSSSIKTLVYYSMPVLNFTT